ncbi:MAG: asparaginase, partial [Defluviitaleaceae bacterium]|nr:asparaginase [Defluviitaleaceae bacterium]
MSGKIKLLIAGGTISMEEQEGKGVVTSDTDIFASSGLSQKKIFEPLLPSPHITPHEMMHIRSEVLHYIGEGYEGIIVTHGTDILEETAYFLDLTLDTDVPVVLIGAMRSQGIGFDGIYNLHNAVKVASCAQARGLGVLVVMNDEIHAARDVTKTHSSNVATFQSPQLGPLGVVTAGNVYMYHKLLNHRRYPLSASCDKLTGNVILLKAYAGMDSQIFDALAQTEVHGLVVEALGQGNLPPAAIPGLEKFLNKGTPVVLVSRCLSGVPMGVYGYPGGGKCLQDAGVIFTNAVNGPKARLKLLVVLEMSKTRAEIETMFV